jgi:dipeptidyl aminopeptidase/acylaminoacyl peptidase
VDPDSTALLFPVGWRTSGRIYKTTLDGQLTALTSGPALDNRPSIDAKGETLAFLREDSASPREVWMLSLHGAAAGKGARPRGPAASPAPKRLTDTNPQTRDFQSFPKEIVTWKGALGQDMEGLLVYPTGYAKGQRVPLMLNVHGGPAGTHSNSFTPPRASGLAALRPGRLRVFFPNPRGSGGYGEAFRSANVGDWGVKDFEDLMKASTRSSREGSRTPTASR